MAKTPLEREYDKELQRINRFIKSAEKRGFRFDQYTTPKRPKTVTKKSVERLRKTTPKTLYAKASYYDPITQTRMTGQEGVTVRRAHSRTHATIVKTQRHPGIPFESQTVLGNIEEMLTGAHTPATWTKSYAELKRKDRNILSNILTGAINELGRDTVVRNCARQAGLIKDLAFHICYGSSDFKWGTIEGDIAAITAIIYGRNLSVDESKQVQDIIDQVQGYENPE